MSLETKIFSKRQKEYRYKIVGFLCKFLKLNLNLKISVESMVYFVLSKQKMFSILPFSEKA